jgi:hypothetical protein
VTVTITAEERDALYEEVYARLSGIDDVWLTISSENYEEAERVAREFSDYLRLLLDDLGWGEGSGESLELTTPPEVLRRIFTRMRDVAEVQRAQEEQERAEVQAREEQAQCLMETCERVLGAVG